MERKSINSLRLRIWFRSDKKQIFESIYNRLRGTLSETCSVDGLISIFNKDFPLSTISIEQESRRVVQIFGFTFINGVNVTPTFFWIIRVSTNQLRSTKTEDQLTFSSWRSRHRLHIWNHWVFRKEFGI